MILFGHDGILILCYLRCSPAGLSLRKLFPIVFHTIGLLNFSHLKVVKIDFLRVGTPKLFIGSRLTGKWYRIRNRIFLATINRVKRLPKLFVDSSGFLSLAAPTLIILAVVEVRQAAAFYRRLKLLVVAQIPHRTV